LGSNGAFFELTSHRFDPLVATLEEASIIRVKLRATSSKLIFETVAVGFAVQMLLQCSHSLGLPPHP
jgi:hypothetical protein